MSGPSVYIGGDFTVVGGKQRNYIAALDAGTGAPATWNPNSNNSVLALAVGGATVYAGGDDFDSIGGARCHNIARSTP